MTWIEERRAAATRSLTLEMKFADGAVLTRCPPKHPGPGGKGLFAQDLELFVMAVRGERRKKEIDEDRNRVIHGLELAEKIKEVAMAKLGT